MAEEVAAAEEGGGLFSSSALKMLMFYMVASQVLKGPAKPAAESNVATTAASSGDGAVARAPRVFLNAWTKEQPMELRVYVTESDTMTSFGKSSLVWHETGLTYARDESSEYQVQGRWAAGLLGFGSQPTAQLSPPPL